MTTIEKEKIRYYRGEGLGYKAIASRLAVSVDAVKGFCRRNGLDGAATDAVNNICRQCGVPLDKKPGAEKKRFCSGVCRGAWWSAHAYLYNHQEGSTRACAFCGRDFDSFQSKGRVYCGHTCYINARYRKECDHDKRAI